MLLLSLAQARLCLDCEWLTDETLCPKCDRDSTVPLAAWFRPLQDDRPGTRRRAGRPRRGRWLIVVQHREQELFRTLGNALADSEVDVIYERRAGDRRRRSDVPTVDRRGADRRRCRPAALLYERTATPVSRVAESAVSVREPAGA